MRVGILTHYDVNNLGAQLQMFATYNKLKELGHEPVVLTYPKNFDFEYEQKLRNQISVRSVPYIFREFVLKKGVRQTWHNTRKFNVNKEFRKQNFQFDNYATAQVDAVIIGADEVFSIPVGINMMMYGHGMLTSNCIAYAPSFGQTSMEDLQLHHAVKLVGEGLKTFTGLSSRDQHTHEMIRKLTGKEAVDVCDPVILYDFKETTMPIRQIPKPYIAIYAYDRNMVDSNEIQQIRIFAKKRGLLTVSVGNYHKWCDKNIVCNCVEWLEYMRQAEYVITDTFHGAVVSTVLHKEVAIMSRPINRNKISSLLKDIHMEDREIRKITVEDLEQVFSKKTDFSEIEIQLNCLRKKGEEYIVKALDK